MVLPTRPRPPDAEEVGFKGRCHVWSDMPETQDYLTVPVLVSVTLQFLTSTLFVYCHFILLLAISCFPIAQLSHVPT